MIFWLFLNLLSLLILSFYSATEMACVSFNRVRLHYYKEQGVVRAKWLEFLLQHPFRLFGTTLIGVNAAMVVGSESARQIYTLLGLNPDFAPLTQVIIVLILGDLAPMFAARHYSEHVAMLGAPFLYASSLLMRPILFVIGGIIHMVNWMFGVSQEPKNFFLTQEELKKVLEEKENNPFNAISANIFELRNKYPKEILTPLNQHPLLPSGANVQQLRQILSQVDASFVPIYHQHPKNIIGIVYPRDLLRLGNHKRIRDYAKTPWFVTENTPITQILKQFQSNRQSVAVILDQKGTAIGLLTLDQLLTLIFGKSLEEEGNGEKMLVINRSFPADTSVGEVEKMIHVKIAEDPTLTLVDLFYSNLSHPPQIGDSIQLGSIELSITEATLLEIKTVSLKGRSRSHQEPDLPLQSYSND